MNIETKLCECGCGEKIVPKPHHKYTGTPNFIHGHGFRGKNHTEQSKQKQIDAKKGKNIGEENPFFGKKHTTEAIQKMRNTAIKRNSDPEYRKKVSIWTKDGMTESVLLHLSSVRKGRKMSTKNKLIRSVSMRGRHSGCNNPAWKGGRTPPNKALRGNWRYKEWRTAVFERDKYTCQKCGKKGCFIEAHHIYPVMAIIDDNEEKI